MNPENSADNLLVTTTCSTIERSTENLTDASRMATLGELAAGVAHNFGNVLMGISVTLELLQMRVQSEPALSDLVNTIVGAQAEVDRGADIIQRLLSLSRSQPLVITSVNPWLAVDSAIALCSTHTNAKKVKLVNLIPNDPAAVKADDGQLTEALVNLILNALQASDGGEVSIELEEDGDEVSIKISDQGCGIPPEDMDKLFDPFFTRRKNGLGTGLGLPCSKYQINRMDGDITVESHPGFGSTFSIVLPKWT